MMSTPSLQFSNLPLEEVAVRIVLADAPPLRFATCFNVWERLKERFDSITDIPTVEVPAGSRMSLPSPLFSLKLERPGVDLTLQPSLLTAKWQREMGVPYSRYDALRGALNEGYLALRAAMGDEAASIQIVNMTYVNLIVPPMNEDPTGYATQFLQPDIIPAALRGRSLQTVDVSWEASDILDLRITLQRVAVPSPIVEADGAVVSQERTAFSLFTIAGTKSTQPLEPTEDLDRMHEALQVLFASVITDRAREEWGYVE